jgi:tRNA dimethylallyltransferase
VVGVMTDRESRRRRITERLNQRLNAGMIDEVKSLIESGINTETLIYYGLEYKFITLYLTGRLSYDNMVRDLEIAIHQFAKRQMTWFRGMERRGIQIHWIEGNLPMETKVARVLDLLIAD